MKKNERTTLRTKSVADRAKIVADAQKELSVIRMQFAVGKVKNVKLMKSLRLKIAVAKTLDSEVQRAEK